MTRPTRPGAFLLAAVAAALGTIAAGQSPVPADLEARVKQFLERHRYNGRDMNAPEADGQMLHDLIVEHKYTRALEIGTSTGRSGIWIALALSKTGGKLVTIDIDKGRHDEAVANFQQAGVAPFIDARLADAHDLVPRLEGPFDFVFIDADKDWYTNYAKAVIPKLTANACIAAHNVYPSGRSRRGMTGDYYEYITALDNFDTTVSPGGLAVSLRRKLP